MITPLAQENHANKRGHIATTDISVLRHGTFNIHCSSLCVVLVVLVVLAFIRLLVMPYCVVLVLCFPSVFRCFWSIVSRGFQVTACSAPGHSPTEWLVF